jgi:hypothetical protein
MCGGPLTSIIDLGDVYLNDFVDKGKEIISAPLHLVRCEACNLVQLKDTADLDKLYRKYWYKSSLNKSMVAALQNIVTNITDRVTLAAGDIVVDIGCNDGTMLSMFNTKGIIRIGIDPALNLAEEASKHCDIFINNYFSSTMLSPQSAKVITSIAMFYDLEDPVSFVQTIKKSLHPSGIWVVQFTDLLSMLKLTAFDTICHEHLEYYSLEVLHKLLLAYDLEIFDLEYNSVNGGSIRVYVGHKGQVPAWTSGHARSKVVTALEEEQNYLNYFYEMGSDPFVAFADRIRETGELLGNWLHYVVSCKEKVYALGASTKGNTLLQVYKIDSELVQKAAEVNPDKFGKLTVATNIPIISEQQAINEQPEYFLILPWHFKDAIIPKVQQAGFKGKFIVPLPNFEVL